MSSPESSARSCRLGAGLSHKKSGWLPYKTSVGASFPWTGDGEGRSGGYFHLSPGEIFVGGGIWHPEPVQLAAFRAVVDREPSRLHEIVEEPRFASTFGPLIGDRLTRVPKGFPADHPEAEILKIKDVGFWRAMSDRDVETASLPDVIAETLEAGVPLLRLLASLPA